MEGGGPIRRRRPALSCVECRRRKIKCDRAEPCANCVAAKGQCIYKTYGVSRGSQFASRHNATRRSSDSAATPRSGANSPSSNTHGDSVQIETAPTPVQLRNSRSTQDPDVGISTSGRNDQPEQPNIAHHGQILSPHRDRRCENEPEVPRVMLNKTRVLRWSHWMGRTEEFIRVFHLYAETFNDLRGATSDNTPSTESPIKANIGELLGRCKSLAKSLKLWRPSRCLSCPQTGFLSPPTREVADVMVANYFRLFESTHRVLHIPSFWKEYQRYWDYTDTIPTAVRLKVLLVISIGSIAHTSVTESGVDRGFMRMVQQWVYAAQTWLSGPLEKDRLDITGIQVYCLTIIARELLSIGGDLVWMSMGSLVNRAMQIGLHKDPLHLPPMPALEMELRRRLWATILEMAVQSSLDSGLPPRISLTDFDSRAPSNINDYDIDRLTTVPEHYPMNTYTQTSIQLALFDSLPLRLQIVQTLNGLQSELSQSKVLSLSAQLTAACKSITKFTRQHTASTIRPFHRNLLDFLVRRFMIPLHCPFSTQTRSTPSFHYSLKVSLDAAIALISPEPDDDFTNLMLHGGGMYREGIRCAATVIGLELISHVENQRLDGTLYRESPYRQMLRSYLQDMVIMSEKRIRLGETNIKFHLFGSMMLGHVTAMEKGTYCEAEMSKAAVESLTLCVGILEELERISGVGELQCPHDVGFTPGSFDEGMDGFGFGVDFGFAGVGLF